MAFWVMIYHIKDAFNFPIISDIVYKGYLGVDVFFILSGYILTHVYFHFFEQGFSKQDFIRFVQKRFARVYPLHFVTLIGAILLLFILNRLAGAPIRYLDHTPFHLFMVHSWGFLDNSRLNFPSWSISAEWFAYLFIFPFSVLLYRKSKWTLYFTLFLSYALFIWVTWEFFQNDFSNILGIGVIRIFPEFIIGSAFYIFHRTKKSIHLALLASSLISIGVICWITLANMDYLIIGFFPLVILSLHTNTPNVRLLFGSKTLTFLGEISYSLYMTHFFAYKINGIIQSRLFGDEIHSGIYIGTFVALTLLFSIASYFFVEVPCRKYINNLKLTPKK